MRFKVLLVAWPFSIRRPALDFVDGSCTSCTEVATSPAATRAVPRLQATVPSLVPVPPACR